MSKSLKTRGIETTALNHDWQVVGNRWQYPIYDTEGEVIATRSKAMNPDDKIKYLWHPSKPDNELAEWYILPGTVAHVEATGGVVYIANGEASALAHHAGNVLNTYATTLSEVAVPKSLQPILEHCSRVLYLADNDDAGLLSATNWRDALAGTGIDFEALSWGDVKKGYDSNDAWIDCDFDPATFQSLLGRLSPLELPTPEPKPDYNNVEFANTDDLVRSIESALSSAGVFTRRTYQGEWRQMTCVHHEDSHPSAGFNIHSGVINCQVCGSHSPWETAELFSIDTAQFRKPVIKKNTKRSVTKKPARPAAPKEELDLEEIYQGRFRPPNQFEFPTIPKDSRTYQQIIDDEIMALDIAYDNGQRISWYAQDDLPISWVSAMLNLSSARSSLVAVWVKMHYALRNGTLKPSFTIKDVVKATGYSTRLIANTIDTLLEMSFIHFLRTVSIDTHLPKESVQIGRRPVLFGIESDSDVLQCCLQNMLERKSRVRVVNRALSKRTGDMQSQLNLDDDAYIAFRNRAELLQSEPINAEADRAYMREMFGNGHEWKGWQRALSVDYAIPLDVNLFDNCKELRVQIALWWIKHVRDINSREDWQRILGCSDPTIDAVFALANIKTIQQNEKLEIKAPSTVKAMQRVYTKTQREYRGKIWKISFKIKGQEGWQASSEFTYKKTFVSNLGKIEKVFMILTTPSKQVLRDADEIEYLEKERQENDDTLVIPGFDIQPEQPEPVEVSEPKPKRVTVASNEHVYTTFPYRWLFRQQQLDVHCYTDYVMSNDGTILDKDNQKIRNRSELNDLIEWLNEVASDKPINTVKSYYGDDYSEEQELKELQAIESIWMFENNYRNRVMPSIVAQSSVHVISHYAKTGLLNKQPVLVENNPLPEPAIMPDTPAYKAPKRVIPKAQYEVVARGLRPVQKHNNMFSDIAKGA